MYFDTHCHLNSEQLYEEREHYVQNALAAGVTQMCVVGYSLASSKLAVQIAHEYPMIYAVVGIGPEDCLETDEKELAALEVLLDDPKVVALGEIGLDYYWDSVPQDQQKEIFAMQIEMAKRHDLPVVIHSREALQDTYTILKEHQAHGIMHCYSGSVEMAKEFVKLGFKISLAGPVTFKNARVPKEVAKAIALEDLLIETDSPYLTPVPYRGKQNEPARVIYIAKEIAMQKGISESEVALVTVKNACDVFKVKQEEEQGENH